MTEHESIWSDLQGVPFSQGYLNAGGVRTRYLHAGDPGLPALMLLHGSGGHAEAYVRNLEAHAEHFSTWSIDMLGHGYTDKPGHLLEVRHYVDHLMAVLDEIGAGRARISGESLGGWVAAWLASEDPGRVASLQLVAAGGTKANPQVMERIKNSTLRAVQTDDIDLTRQRLNLLMYDEANVTDELVEIRHRIYHQPDFVKNVHNLLCLQEMEIRQRNLLREDRLARISAPTLVVWGHENPFGDIPEAERLHAAIAGSRLELFPRCGHWPQHEHHERYNQLSLTFLAEAARPRDPAP